MPLDPEYADQLQKAVDLQMPKIAPAADRARLEGIDAALTAQSGRAVALTMRKARAAAKYGPDSDQAVASGALLDAHAQAAAATQTLREQAAIDPPELPPESAAVYGRVVGPAGAGIVGAAVVALDANLSGLAKDASREGGAYRLVLSLRGLKPAGDASTPSVTVTLRVSADGMTQADRPDPLTLSTGMTLFREIVMTPAQRGAPTPQG